MALITGLYKPTSGRILLGNCDLTALDLSAVRGYVGVVEQTVGLLSGTITSNIAYGKVSFRDANINAYICVLDELCKILVCSFDAHIYFLIHLY